MLCEFWKWERSVTGIWLETKTQGIFSEEIKAKKEVAPPFKLTESAALHFLSFPHCDGSHVKKKKKCFLVVLGCQDSTTLYIWHFSFLLQLDQKLKEIFQNSQGKEEEEIPFCYWIVNRPTPVWLFTTLEVFLSMFSLFALWIMIAVFGRRYLEVGEISYFSTKSPSVVHRVWSASSLSL